MKLCECGCGQPAPISTKNRPERGQFRGQPVRFINGHNSHRHTEECKQRIGEAGRGRVPSEATRRKISESKLGSRNPAWRGGQTLLKKHRLVYVGVGHAMAYKTGYVLEHRLVMARVLGRPLESHEHVHHIDLDSLNNDPANLIIVTPSQHSRLHRMIDWHNLDPREALARVLEKAAA